MHQKLIHLKEDVKNPTGDMLMVQLILNGNQKQKTENLRALTTTEQGFTHINFAFHELIRLIQASFELNKQWSLQEKTMATLLVSKVTSLRLVALKTLRLEYF